jgi:hypothetical protein
MVASSGGRGFPSRGSRAAVASEGSSAPSPCAAKPGRVREWMDVSPDARVTCQIGHDGHMLARGLLMLSSAVFAAAGLAYLAVPGLALGVVGIPSSPASDFLLRTESVPLLFGAAMTWAVRDGGRREQRIALVALAGYYVLSSIIDLAAFAQGVVGAPSVPSAVVRIAIGTICAAAAISAGRAPAGTPPS